VAPIIAIGISVAYFISSPREQALSGRLLASSHGVAMALLYAALWAVPQGTKLNSNLGNVYPFTLLFPFALIVTSFFVNRGNKLIHWLQLINLLCLLWIGIAGVMRVTGQSL
jgi:hypothetical protein